MEKNSTKADILLIDASSYLFRAYHAMPDLRSQSQHPVGAIYGFVSMFKRLLLDYPSAYVACVFDAQGGSFRNNWYPQYKANRPAMPEDLVSQIEPIHEWVRLQGLALIVEPGVEADDIIGTLNAQAHACGQSVLISTNDKDLAQLVQGKTCLINTMSNELLDIQGVISKFGVKPEQIVDYLSLVGDAVDNVPGVDKVGPKTAVKWLRQYGCLDNIMRNAQEIQGVVGENLRKTLDWLPTAKKLITIMQDLDLALTHDWPNALLKKPPHHQALADFYKTHGFRSFYKELMESNRPSDKAPTIAKNEQNMPNSAETSPTLLGKTETHPSLTSEQSEPSNDLKPARIKNYVAVIDSKHFEIWLNAIENAEIVAIDTETDNLDPMLANLVGISLSIEAGHACYIPLGHQAICAPVQLSRTWVLERLSAWLADPNKIKVGQNIKYDTQLFSRYGLSIAGFAHDTMLQSYLLEPHMPHNLESLAFRHLGYETISYEDVCGKGGKKITFDQVALEPATHYAAEDADLTLQLQQKLYPELKHQSNLLKVYEHIEIPVAHVLRSVEAHGVLIDSVKLAQQSHDLEKNMFAAQAEAHQLAGRVFNLASAKQVAEVLFTEKGLPMQKKTSKGAASTDEETLQALAEDFPLAALILQHRACAKLKATYTDKLAHMINPHTGRVHTNYAQAVAVTGRLSSNAPNLQNIPIRTAEGRRIREAFIAPKQHKIVSIDYSQIELRIMAHFAQDEGLIYAFANGVDIHRATAAEVFGISLDDVNSEQRRFAKTINFGLIYGMSAFGLARSLRIERSAAQIYIDRYFARYPRVAQYMQQTRESARSLGYVETDLGRRLYLPEIRSSQAMQRAAAERAAINAPMQGTAADLIKLAMIAVNQELYKMRKGTKMIMQVHDELVFEVPDTELDWVKQTIPPLMCKVHPLRVPLEAQVGIGDNWDQAH